MKEENEEKNTKIVKNKQTENEYTRIGTKTFVCLQKKFFSFAFSTFIYFVFLLNIYITMRVLRTVSPSLCNQSYKEWVLVAPYKVDEVSVYFVQSPNFIFISNFFSLAISFTRSLVAFSFYFTRTYTHVAAVCTYSISIG